MSVDVFNEKVAYWNDQARNPEPPFDEAMLVTAGEMRTAAIAMAAEPGSVLSGLVGLLPIQQAVVARQTEQMPRNRVWPSQDHLHRALYGYQHVGLAKLPKPLGRALGAMRPQIAADLRARGFEPEPGERLQPDLRLGWYYRHLSLDLQKIHRIQSPVFEYIASQSSSAEQLLRMTIWPGYHSEHGYFPHELIDDVDPIHAPVGYMAVIGSNTLHCSPEFCQPGYGVYRLFTRLVVDL